MASIIFTVLKKQKMSEKKNNRFSDDTIRKRVEESLGKIRPLIQRDGGDVELVDVVDGVVQVRLKGACNGCPMAGATLSNGIERTIKEEVPEIRRVEAVP
jgi:Fe-S cluster biogenesis protein NfuA